MRAIPLLSEEGTGVVAVDRLEVFKRDTTLGMTLKRDCAADTRHPKPDGRSSHRPQLVLAQPKVVPHLMQQRGADLPAHLRVAPAYRLDVALV
jgi:hypothetical protein